MLGGRFLVFDGPDGSGKTTQFERFGRHCLAEGLGVCEVREPGGTSIGEQIRDVLLAPGNEEMDLRCEMLLYMASRAQLIAELVEPALERGDVVLADRFISSTFAYQGAAGGMPGRDIEAVGTVAVAGHWPDLIIILDADEAVAAVRRSATADRIERRDDAYHRRVRQGYLDMAAADPTRHLVLDASASQDSVFEALLEGLERWVEATVAEGS